MMREHLIRSTNTTDFHGKVSTWKPPCSLNLRSGDWNAAQPVCRIQKKAKVDILEMGIGTVSLGKIVLGIVTLGIIMHTMQ
ncbi:hypothetical protein [Shimia aestuarii]|uniref:hypothetical protein n=1 Tax=Shimia aestuarii TaxID=254406 RepID=UPI000B886D7F|nr:hypothetical protein [Shimia aestuarii]